MENSKTFTSKVLLFGEYTIINGSSGLAIPFEKYSGCWKKSDGPTSLQEFFSFLISCEGVDQKKVEQAQAENWVFHSDIPLGYGLGSSGALTAAAYAAFFLEQEHSHELLQQKLASIESFFHGKSSGLDPLASFLNKPIHISNNQVKVLDKLTLPSQLFLFDSQKGRVSKPLIQHYKLLLDADSDFREKVKAISLFNDRIINEIIAGEDISASFKELSRLQYDSFDKMIPAAIKELWREGLENESYYFKLSGAGGGGFFLVYGNEKDLNPEQLVHFS